MGRSRSRGPSSGSSRRGFSSSSRSQGGGLFSTNNKQSTNSSSPPPQARPAPAHPPVVQQQSASSGLLGTVAQGMAFGGGSAMAHRAVDAVLGPRYGPVQPMEAHQAAETIVQEGMACGSQAKSFSDCMSLSGGDMEACRVFFERMQECRMALSE